jgi:transposase
VANDKLTIGERSVRLPLIGRVAMKESMRFAGTVKGASVSRHGTSWFLAVQVDLDVCWLTKVDRRPVVGVDLNVNEIGCSNGKQYEAPRPLKKAQRRLAKLQRSVSRGSRRKRKPGVCRRKIAFRRERASLLRRIARRHRECSLISIVPHLARGIAYGVTSSKQSKSAADFFVF